MARVLPLPCRWRCCLPGRTSTKVPSWFMFQRRWATRPEFRPGGRDCRRQGTWPTNQHTLTFILQVNFYYCVWGAVTLDWALTVLCCLYACPPGAGAGDVCVIIVDSNSRRDTVEIVLENRGDSIFRCTYVPVLEGPHTVYVTFAGQQIPRSPFTVHISEGRFLHTGQSWPYFAPVHVSGS